MDRAGGVGHGERAAIGGPRLEFGHAQQAQHVAVPLFRDFAIGHVDVVAQLAFDSASDLAPEEAAAVFAEILDARVPVHDLKRWMTSEDSPLKVGR